VTFVLLEVGCLECGEATKVLGVYEDGMAAFCDFESENDQRGPDGVPLDDHVPAREFFKETAVKVGPFGRLQLHEVGES
jgi:hypothetical protein